MIMEKDSLVARLEACPFCGNDGSGPIEDALQVVHNEPDYVHDHRHTWSVQCDKCTATMGYFDSEEEAIEAWNRRAALSRPEQVVTPTSERPTGDAWKLVPVEPTNDMCVAGWKYADERDAVLGNGEVAALYRAMLASAPASPAIGIQAVKALDLSNLIRDAFLSGRGLKDGDKLSEADQAAFMEYDPTEYVSYKRIFAALYPSLTSSDTAPSPKGVSDGVRAALEAELAELEAANEAATSWGAAVGARQERINHIRSALAALSQEPVPATSEERAASKEGA